MRDMTHCGLFILWLLKQAGKAYRMGAEVALTEEEFGDRHAWASQREWDCSELVQAGLWAAAVATVNGHGVKGYDLAARQWQLTPKISVADARDTPGALVFIRSSGYDRPHGIGHVGVIIAPDTVLEARGRDYGVVIGPVRSSFNEAAKVPELYVPVEATLCAST